MNPVVHFELPVKDAERANAFYTGVFGWKANKLGPEMNNYIVVDTDESDKNGPLKPGRINGGLYGATPEMGPRHPSIVIAVPDIKAHIQKVIAAGGTVQGEPVEIPGVGLYASFTDTEGNSNSMLQPKM